MLGMLASGGMGAVYTVEQLSTGKRRALKVLYPQFVRDAAGRARFAQEARIGADIDSDHVVEIVGAGIDDDTGTPWLAMELLDGQDLAALAKERGRFDAESTLALMEQLCDALGKAHARGIVHRDLKPENLFVAAPRRRGVKFTLKILDFGIAKVIQENRTAATVSATIASPLWMAPEQASTEGRVRPSTDVWALGLIAFRLLTGAFYWTSANGPTFNLSALVVEVMGLPIEPASVRAARLGAADTLPPGFDAWFARCVDRVPEARFRDASAAFEALAPLLSAPARPYAATQDLAHSPYAPTAPIRVTPPFTAPGGPSAPLPPVANSVPLPQPRRTWVLAGGVAASLALLAGAVAWILSEPSGERSPSVAAAATPIPAPGPAAPVQQPEPAVAQPEPAVAQPRSTRPAPMGASGMEGARACMSSGGSQSEVNRCIVGALRSSASAEPELRLLCVTYRSQGDRNNAVSCMRRYNARFPGTRYNGQFDEYIRGE